MRKILLSVFCLSLVCLAVNIYAQNSNAPKQITKTYLFRNANIVQSPGKILSYSDLLVKDGLITKIGKSIQAPYDAKIINADSLYIYPSFIDGGSHVGFKEKKAEKGDFKPTDNPTFEQSGITPQLTVRDFFDAKALKNKRKAGIGYVQVLPQEAGMLPGKGSIVTTGKGGYEELVLAADNVSYATFKPVNRIYPSTIMGVMKMYRDVIKNTRNTKKYNEIYKNSPKGNKRLKNVEEYQALYPVVTGEMSFYFKSTNPKEVLRVLKLQKELDFKVVIADVKQGMPIIDKIKASKNPVLLSLKLPKELKEDKDSTATAEVTYLKERRLKSYNEYLAQAKMFKEKNILFGFSMLDMNGSDVKKNLSRVVKAGLSEKDALASVTINNAIILGIDNVSGTLEVGKIGNLFITDKPYFDEKSKIKFTFIDGHLDEVKSKKKGKANGKIEGTYTYTTEIPGSNNKGTMIITKSGSDYEVKLNSDDEPEDFIDGEDVNIDGENLTFYVSIDGMKIDFDLKVKEAAFEGTLSIGEFGSFPIKGKLENPESK